ncbi:type IV secretion protein Rhs [Caulobacter vibrioides]|uniref:phage baseplate assembly protein V n=1 Tax=Caulobacter radicis TaxID=2172650 RepID=UPI00071CD830|nr:phage baseplate assembly protein V [Caulobacter radicis]KSB91820.1 type IV secretion protein Rhs [Caulobacter vibrioides]PVM88441.1 type IV secretion protein Rhs [Caulobacter radicis]
MIARDPKGVVLPFARPRLAGVYPALVRDVQDPDQQGRVKIELPFVGDDDGPSAQAWARLSTALAGASRGTWFIPEPGDEVLVAFEAGDPRRPVVIGSLWNGEDSPPETMNANNDVRSFTSRSGHKLTFDDTDGATKVQVKTQGGHELTLDDASGGKITVSHSNGASVVIDAAGNVKITANANCEVQAAMVKVTASMVTVDAAMSKFSGVVKADTVITNSVVSSSYTPGAGNVW